jgi:Ni/Fe-hydrogenase 1 B-type cytochrome subunit
MNTTQPLSTTILSPQAAFNESHARLIRIWHWTFFIAMTAQLVTVLFASTLFRTRNNIGLVQQEMQHQGVTIGNDQARGVAHAFNDRLWDWHTYVGYVICGFLLARVVIELTLSKEERLATKIRQAIAIKRSAPADAESQQHYLRVKWSYVIFYCLILTMALTGLCLAFDDLPMMKGIRGPARQVHGFVQYLIYGFIVLHLGGVIIADIGKHHGIVSGMIHGKKRPQ